MSTPSADAVQHFDAPVAVSCPLLRKYIYYSTILGIFSIALYLDIGVHFFLFDAIMLINLVLMFPLVNYVRVPVWIPCFLLYLAASGLLGISAGTDTPALFLKEFVGITISLLYFYYFFRLIENDYERAFYAYVRIALYLGLMGMPLWLLNCIRDHSLLRLQGLNTEPAQLCIYCLPACYWYAYQYITQRKHGWEFAALLAIIFFSGSSLGYISLAFGVILLTTRNLRHFLLGPVLVMGLFYFVYTTSSSFQMRLNDTLFATENSTLSDSDFSTYALLSNAYVTREVFRERPLLGNGLGSHLISHERFLGSIPGVESFMQYTLPGVFTLQSDLNAGDAASLGLRSLSELGLVGCAGILVFLVHFYVGGRTKYAAISNAVLVCFFLKLLRNGTYFPPDQFFLVFVYILNHRRYKLERARNEQAAATGPTENSLRLLEN